MKKNNENVFKIDPGKISNPLFRLGVGLSRPLIEHTLCFPALNSIYNECLSGDEAISFPRRILETMNVSFKVDAPEENPIPAEGPVVIVSNHPFGGIEGILMLAMMEQYRADTKVMANYMLSMMPALRDHFFFVDPFGGAEAKRANLKSMKSCLKWLEDGHVLGVFPAGEVSSIDLKSGKVRDPKWSTTIAKMARKTGATVIPVFFGGNNGVLFNMAGLVHPRLRTLMLPKQFVNKTNREITIEIGQTISNREIAEYDDDEKLMDFLRLRTYNLGERESAKPPKRQIFHAKEAKKPFQAKIIDAIPPAELADEINALPPECRMCDAEGLSVFCAAAGQIPKTLREIGRLREITYRAVGEGTNLEIDLDAYDTYYRHLFIWNAEKQEIVGAYRLGLADEIVPSLGVRGLYTHTCFKFDARLVNKLQPAIELGRSFVRKEYQRAYSSLMLLWKGLCVFISHNPHYTTFFGPVSISNDYLVTSRNMILRSLRFSNFENDLAKLVKPRCRPKKAKKAEWTLPDYKDSISDLDQVSKMVQDIESDHKGIPVLLRQYVKMGGKILAFNVDPAFNYCVDGLIAVNVPKVDPRVLKRYMGAEDYAAYIAAHAEKK